MSTIKALLFGDPLPTHDRKGKSKGILHRSVAIAANDARGMPPGNYQQGAVGGMYQQGIPPANYQQMPMPTTTPIYQQPPPMAYNQQQPPAVYGQQPQYAQPNGYGYEGVPPPQYEQQSTNYTR